MFALAIVPVCITRRSIRRVSLKTPVFQPFCSQGEETVNPKPRWSLLKSGRRDAESDPYDQRMTEADNESLDDFLASVERRAFRMAVFATRDRDEALDLVQDAMLRFVRRYGGRPGSERRPLFYRVLENRILDWHRARRRSWVQLFGDDRDDENPSAVVPAAASADPLHALQRGLSMNRLASAVTALPLRQQQVFLLRIWEGLDVADTARAMGIGAGSVKTHLSRALARLRTELGEEWP